MCLQASRNLNPPLGLPKWMWWVSVPLWGTLLQHSVPCLLGNTRVRVIGSKRDDYTGLQELRIWGGFGIAKAALKLFVKEGSNEPTAKLGCQKSRKRSGPLGNKSWREPLDSPTLTSSWVSVPHADSSLQHIWFHLQHPGKSRYSAVTSQLGHYDVMRRYVIMFQLVLPCEKHCLITLWVTGFFHHSGDVGVNPVRTRSFVQVLRCLFLSLHSGLDRGSCFSTHFWFFVLGLPLISKGL